jgi:hypothetical protein
MRDAKGIATIVVASFVLVSGTAAGQEAGPGPRWQPYTFAAPGGISNAGTTLHLGGGADVLIWKGLGASVEGGYVGPIRSMDYGIGLVSANALYQFGRPGRTKVTPFVTGGYSVGFRSSAGDAVNVGAGANYWITERTALRFEVRDHVPIGSGIIRGVDIWGVRVGFTWRR